MKTTFSLAGWLVLGLTAAASGQALDPAAIQRASTETLLSMPEPPIGYATSKHPLTAGDQLLGFRVQVTKEDAVSKVMINVETRDRSDRGARVAASKGYVNGFVSELQKQGFQITAKNLPDVETADFKTPLAIDITFANAEGTTIHVKKWIFFTTKGFDVTVIATDAADLKLLTDWAAHVQPAAASPRP